VRTVCNQYTLFLKPLFVFFQAIVILLENLSIDSMGGDVPEIEAGKRVKVSVAGPIMLAVLIMLIEK
jgi:hypothetical protein